MNSKTMYVTKNIGMTLRIRSFFLISVALFFSLLARPKCSLGQADKAISDSIRITPRSLNCVLPFHCESLEKFIEISTQVSRQKSIENIVQILHAKVGQHKTTDLQPHKKPNAYCIIEQDETKLTSVCRIDWEHASREGEKADPTLLKLQLNDGASILKTIARRAQIETSSSMVRGIRVEYGVWGDTSGRFKTLRKVLLWKVELGENENARNVTLATFPALKGESAIKLEGSGLRLLRMNNESSVLGDLNSALMIIASEK